MCDFLGDSSEGCAGSAVIHGASSLLPCLPSQKRESVRSPASLKQGEEGDKQVTGRGHKSQGRGRWEGEEDLVVTTGKENQGETKGSGGSNRDQETPKCAWEGWLAPEGKLERERGREDRQTETGRPKARLEQRTDPEMREDLKANGDRALREAQGTGKDGERQGTPIPNGGRCGG